MVLATAIVSFLIHYNVKHDSLTEIENVLLRQAYLLEEIAGSALTAESAPELNEHLSFLIERLYPLVPRILVRSNLSALNDGTRDHLFGIFRE